MTYTRARRCLHSNWTKYLLGLAAAPVVAALATPAGAQATQPSRMPFASPRVTAFPLNAPPINGFVARVAFGLTDKQLPNDETFSAFPSTTLTGNTMPRFNPAYYSIATFDSGSQSHIVTQADAAIFNFTSAGREGNYQSEVAGASGTEVADISDPIGMYMTGLGNATGGTSLSVNTATMVGQYNTSILTTETGSVLPNIIGSPMIAQYQTVIRTSVHRTVTVGGATYHSPDVSFQPLDTAYPSNYSRLTFDVMSPSGVAPDPVFIPSLDNFNNFADNPTTPTFWGSLFATANATDTGGTATGKQFLFDTGAQITVMSQDTAAEVGFNSAGENPSTPDFFVEVEGVGGSQQQVPGFYLDQLKVTTNGGPITWTHVPVVVLDVIDPRDGVGYVPGILGMNLFTDRDLILNGGLSDPSVAISPQQRWIANANGNFGDGTKWNTTIPNDVDRVANFLSAITAPRTINIDANYTVGSINFDNANSYTLSGTGRLTLNSSEGPAGITVASGNHTISAPMTFATDTSLTVLPAGSKLTISNDVIATNAVINKNGDGTAEMKNVRAKALELDGGKLVVLHNATANSTATVSDVKSISATSGRLDLKNNALIVRGTNSGGTGTIGTWNGTAYAGVTGLIASGSNGGTQDGAGIVTTEPSATSGNTLTALAVARAEDVGLAGGTFAGRSVLAGDVIVKYTYGGDSNLDGSITGDDYFQIDSAFPANLHGWLNGDFNYDGFINGDDYFIIDSNFPAQGAAFPSDVPGQSDGLLLVPEPASVAIIFPSLLMLRRRRRV